MACVAARPSCRTRRSTRGLVARRTLALGGGGQRDREHNLPWSNPVELRADVNGYQSQTLWTAPNVTSAWFHLDVANNDFSEGLYGWTVTNTALVSTVYHSETSVPWVPCPTCLPRGPASGDEGNRASTTSLPGYIGTNHASAKLAGSANRSNTAAVTPDAGSDIDMIVENRDSSWPVTSTRPFVIVPGTKEISVRYRFQSFEPQMRNPQNDWFLVKLQSTQTGQYIQDYQTVGSLWFQLDANGATPWKTIALPISVEGDTSQIVRCLPVAKFR